jgi:hypothetical protein
MEASFIEINGALVAEEESGIVIREDDQIMRMIIIMHNQSMIFSRQRRGLHA